MEDLDLGKLYAIHLEPYNPAWVGLFEKEKQALAQILEDLAQRIEHIGSTAIVKIMSKPTIDILVEIPPGHDASETITKKMVRNGYIHMEEQKKQCEMRASMHYLLVKRFVLAISVLYYYE